MSCLAGVGNAVADFDTVNTSTTRKRVSLRAIQNRTSGLTRLRVLKLRISDPLSPENSDNSALINELNTIRVLGGEG